MMDKKIFVFYSSFGTLMTLPGLDPGGTHTVCILIEGQTVAFGVPILFVEGKR